VKNKGYASVLPMQIGHRKRHKSLPSATIILDHVERIQQSN
jgi:hypothetical protein